MDSDDEIKQEFERFAARERGRVCNRRITSHNQNDLPFVNTGRGAAEEDALDWWNSTFVDDPNVMAPAIGPPPQACALPNPKVVQRASDGAGYCGVAAAPKRLEHIVPIQEQGAAALTSFVPSPAVEFQLVPALPTGAEQEAAALTNFVPSPAVEFQLLVPALPTGAVPKRRRSTGVRRAASARAPIQQRPRRRQRALDFGAPIANILQDNSPAESAAAENNARRRDDVQAVALNGREREEETSQRVLGEIAFQLDRRILSYIFTDQFRLYGFNIPDINQKINEVAGGDRQRDEMNARNTEIMNRLRKFEYCPINHSTFAEFIVNNYGILKEKPQCQLMLTNYNNPDYLQKLIVENTPPPLLMNMLVLFASLRNLSEADGRPMFIW